MVMTMHKLKTYKGWYLMSKNNRRIKGPADERTIDQKIKQIKANQAWNQWMKKYHKVRTKK